MLILRKLHRPIKFFLKNHAKGHRYRIKLKCINTLGRFVLPSYAGVHCPLCVWIISSQISQATHSGRHYCDYASDDIEHTTS